MMDTTTETATDAHKLRAACDRCHQLKNRCARSSKHESRCDRCVRLDIDCLFRPNARMGRPRGQRRQQLTAPASNTEDEGQTALTAIAAPTGVTANTAITVAGNSLSHPPQQALPTPITTWGELSTSNSVDRESLNTSALCGDDEWLESATQMVDIDTLAENGKKCFFLVDRISR